MTEVAEKNKKTVNVSDSVNNSLYDQIDALSYNDKLMLLERIIKTLSMPQVVTIDKSIDGFDEVFGLWKDRDVTLESIRSKAWGRRQ